MYLNISGVKQRQHATANCMPTGAYRLLTVKAYKCINMYNMIIMRRRHQWRWIKYARVRWWDASVLPLSSNLIEDSFGTWRSKHKDSATNPENKEVEFIILHKTDGIHTCRKRWAASWDTCQRRAARWPGPCAPAPGRRRWMSGSWWRRERSLADCCWWACAARRCSGPRWGPAGPLQMQSEEGGERQRGEVGRMRRN